MKSQAAQIVIGAISNNPGMSSRGLAALLYSRDPLLWPNESACRDMIRGYRGIKSGWSKKHKRGETFTSTHGYIPLPSPIVGLASKWPPVQVEFDTALVISDVHLPFHDDSLEVALAEGKRRGVDAIIINGDLLDFYSLSFFDKDVSITKLVDEREQGEAFLEHLRGRFPKAQIIYKEGNHEERLWRYMIRKCVELKDLPELSLAGLLHTNNYGVRMVTDKRPIKAGPHLQLLHGHEFLSPMTNPVNPARGLYLRTKCNSMCGDMHQTSQHTEAGLASTVSTWSVGCLCQLHPAYMPLNKWNHGFAFIHLHGDEWRVENLKVINGAVV